MSFEGFDWKNPDYNTILQSRIESLRRIRQNPDSVPALKEYYRDNIADFICDWGMTFDPRLSGGGGSAYIPFILFERQIEWINWVLERWRRQEPGVTMKSRDMGISWLSVAVAASLCLFHRGIQVGFGSRKEELVDKSGSPKSLFHRARQFIMSVPREFRAGFDDRKTSAHLRLSFPETQSFMIGEAGDNMGRGDRSSLYIKDESAHYERPDIVEAALSETSPCMIDVSTPNGPHNPFATKWLDPNYPKFMFHWRDDPRKDDDWYAKKKAFLDPHIVAQEIDADLYASILGVVIPNLWARAAVDAFEKLGITPSGLKHAALDIGDEGDHSALVGGTGVCIEWIEEWSGTNSDLFATMQRAINSCDVNKFTRLRYDGDGMGAACRGDARVINDARAKRGLKPIDVVVFKGSSAVVNPNGKAYGTETKNVDFFANAKAQGWWELRERFRKTYMAVYEGKSFDPDELISISSKAKNVDKLLIELSQPTFSTSSQTGKMVIDKKPDGSKSPNLADAVMMRYSALGRSPMKINESALL